MSLATTTYCPKCGRFLQRETFCECGWRLDGHRPFLDNRPNDLYLPSTTLPPTPSPRVSGPVGWVCPVCGRGNGPFTATCPCIPMSAPVVTCGVNFVPDAQAGILNWTPGPAGDAKYASVCNENPSKG